MALAYSSAVQDRIALRLHNVAYSSLQAQDKTAIDGNWSSGTPGGHAGEALTLIRRYANFVEAAGADQAPDDWVSWLVWEVVWRASHHMHPDRARDARAQRDEAMRAALTTYARDDADSTTTTEGLVFGRVNVRRYVLDHCVRRTPLYLPSPAIVDSCLRSVIYRVWKSGRWSWRRYHDRATIPVSSSLTPAVSYASGNVPDGVSSSVCFYDDGDMLVFVNADDMTLHHARGYDDGKPARFRVLSTPSGLVWQFDRGNDKPRTFRCELLLACPDLTTNEGISAALARMPQSFFDPMRRMILAEVLSDAGRADGFRLKREAQADLDRLLTMDAVSASDETLERSRSREIVAHTLANQWPGSGVIGGVL